MAYDRNIALNIARGEIGYHEKDSNANLDDKTANSGSGNYTKYARDLDAIGFYNGPKQGYPYCDVGYDWCLFRAYGAEAALRLLCQSPKSAGAGCLYSAQYYKQHGQFYGPGTIPEPVDQIFFTYKPGEVSHTGMVESVSGNQITCIEFNTSDMVARRYYTVGDSCIYGYGRPRWDMDGDTARPAPTSPADPEQTDTGSAACTVPLPVLSRGAKGESVRAAQLLLIGRGYRCGPWGADADFGRATEGGVLSFQRGRRLAVDGIIGAETWAALLGLRAQNGSQMTKTDGTDCAQF